MKKILLLLLVTLTPCVKAQLNTSNPLNDTSFIRNFARICAEHREYKVLISKLDSINLAQKESLDLLGLEIESCKMNEKILSLDGDQKSQVLAQSYVDNQVLKSENEKLARKLKRQKRLKWVTGALGLGIGLVMPFLL